jgi:HK97 family phage portal protein
MPLFPWRPGRAAPEAKQSRSGPLIALTGAGRPRWTPRDYASLASEGFARNAVAYRCVRMIAEACAATPLVVFVDGVRDDAHPVARLMRKPNPEQSGAEWLEGLYGALQTAGNAYAEAVGDAFSDAGSASGSGGPEELWTLRPDRVSVVPGKAGWPEAYEYSVGGRSLRIGRAADGWSPVMHLRLWHPTDDHYGFSPIEAAASAIDVHNASGAWNKALLDNAARPSGALVFDSRDGEHLTEAQFAALKAELADAHSGAGNAGRPLVLEGGLDWKPMSMSPSDMDFIAGKHAAAREIALAFGVSPQLLGIPGDATYANYREANAAFWRGTVVPLVKKTAGALSGWLGGRFEGLEITPDLDAVPALQTERDALWARLNAASFLTDEERRRMAGVGG